MRSLAPIISTILLVVAVGDAFVPGAGGMGIRRRGPPRAPAPAAAAAASNGRAPSQKDYDNLIAEMLETAPYELPSVVSRSLKLVSSPSFFVRIAELNDVARSTEDKEKLAALADTVMTTLDVIVRRTEEQVDTSAETLQSILAVAAEDDGEFLVPLSAEKALAFRAAVLERTAVLDDGFLSTVNAWMRKSEETGLSGMVTILQNVLQQYASAVLMSNPALTATSKPKTAADLLDKIMATDPATWDAAIAAELDSAAADSVCDTESLLGEVQARIETIVLGQGAGTYAQQVQAEYLKELTERIQQASIVVE